MAEPEASPQPTTRPRAPVPTVAIVGRPNVGKSTLFNRLVGQRLSVVHDTPGTTRDRLAAQVVRGDTPFLLVDTGGLLLDGADELETKVRDQVQVAMADADLLLFLTDAATGLHPVDAEVADLLRRQDKPVILAVNKSDNDRRGMNVAEFYRLGLGRPLPISALHNRGTGGMLERIAGLLPPTEPEEETEGVLRLALVGRPNVGKSSLLNAILGSERSIVSPTPGTTRDAVDTSFAYRDRPMVLIDTAGLRRRGHIQPGIERYSALRVFQAIQRCDVAVLLTDASEPVTAQDLHVAGAVTDAFRGLVVAVSKWDLAQEGGLDQPEVLQHVRTRLRWAPYAPVRFTSAVTGEGTDDLLETALAVFDQRGKVVSQHDLDRVLLDAVAAHPPPTVGSRAMRVFRIAQSGTHPPAFSVYVNNPALIHFSYMRFLENTLRREFGFLGNHIRLELRTERKARRRRSS